MTPRKHKKGIHPMTPPRYRRTTKRERQIMRRRRVLFSCVLFSFGMLIGFALVHTTNAIFVG